FGLQRVAAAKPTIAVVHRPADQFAVDRAGDLATRLRFGLADRFKSRGQTPFLRGRFDFALAQHVGADIERAEPRRYQRRPNLGLADALVAARIIALVTPATVGVLRPQQPAAGPLDRADWDLDIVVQGQPERQRGILRLRRVAGRAAG